MKGAQRVSKPLEKYQFFLDALKKLVEDLSPNTDAKQMECVKIFKEAITILEEPPEATSMTSGASKLVLTYKILEKGVISIFSKANWIEKSETLSKEVPKAPMRKKFVDLLHKNQTVMGLLQLAILSQPLRNKITKKNANRTLLWVDDHPENNEEEIKKVKQLGILCEQKVSTEEAIEFLKQNCDRLKNCSSFQFRTITDQYREGEGEDAGKNLIDYLRQEGWVVPVMVYSTNSLSAVHLQAQYSNVLSCDDDAHLSLYFSGMNNEVADEMEIEIGEEENVDVVIENIDSDVVPSESVPVIIDKIEIGKEPDDSIPQVAGVEELEIGEERVGGVADSTLGDVSTEQIEKQVEESSNKKVIEGSVARKDDEVEELLEQFDKEKHQYTQNDKEMELDTDFAKIESLVQGDDILMENNGIDNEVENMLAEFSGEKSKEVPEKDKGKERVEGVLENTNQTSEDKEANLASSVGSNNLLVSIQDIPMCICGMKYDWEVTISSDDNMDCSGLTLKASFVQPEELVGQEANLVDNGNGTYLFSFVARAATSHVVKILLGEEEVYRTSFLAKAGACSPDNTVVNLEGKALKTGAYPTGVALLVSIVSHDSCNNKITGGGEEFEIFLERENHSSTIPLKVIDNDDGTYVATIIPTHDGDYSLHARLNGEYLTGTPFAFKCETPVSSMTNVVESELGLSLEKSSLKDISTSDGACLGGSSKFTIGRLNGFKILTRDHAGHRLTQGGHHFKVHLSCDGNNFEGFVEDNDDGTYTVLYFLTKAPKDQKTYSLIITSLDSGQTISRVLTQQCNKRKFKEIEQKASKQKVQDRKRRKGENGDALLNKRRKKKKLQAAEDEEESSTLPYSNSLSNEEGSEEPTIPYGNEDDLIDIGEDEEEDEEEEEEEEEDAEGEQGNEENEKNVEQDNDSFLAPTQILPQKEDDLEVIDVVGMDVEDDYGDNTAPTIAIDEVLDTTSIVDEGRKETRENDLGPYLGPTLALSENEDEKEFDLNPTIAIEHEDNKDVDEDLGPDLAPTIAIEDEYEKEPENDAGDLEREFDLDPTIALGFEDEKEFDLNPTIAIEHEDKKDVDEDLGPDLAPTIAIEGEYGETKKDGALGTDPAATIAIESDGKSAGDDKHSTLGIGDEIELENEEGHELEDLGMYFGDNGDLDPTIAIDMEVDEILREEETQRQTKDEEDELPATMIMELDTH
eukprot:CAMPEP_0174253052 /NCGR_PEP_ID=MMETSP0439-20130205/2394_1 /TAXON_ID=0 /ORGANISM="Stereomyxa ramosa, Strain Chinc5" /LENGTH=1199 /DNA_ID=CAMNT_0015333859 /DNA_START=71 /DNA_END=3670 /DNA_ORIENTATION=-